MGKQGFSRTITLSKTLRNYPLLLCYSVTSSTSLMEYNVLLNTSPPPIFKLANGTDIIDSKGKRLPTGFGSRLIISLNDAVGYRDVAPNNRWEIK